MGIHKQTSFKIEKHANLLHRSHQSGWQGTAKKLLDQGTALTALIVLSPLLLGIAAAIKLDSRGPVIFKQPRHGLKNKVFGIWKFRTMSVVETGENVKQAEVNDHRITRIGAFLRKSSIDELPQLVNVLTGDMSLVGPRPHPVSLNHEFGPTISNYWARHAVKPGLTGYAQVKGFRGPTDTHDKMRLRVEYDLQYIEDWSLWMDIKILVSTPFLILSGKNAF